MASSSSSPDQGSIEQVASKALQCKTVKVRRLEDSVFCNYRLQSRSECFYVFKRRPSTHVRLLRHEEERLQLEAVALQILRGRPNVEVPRVIEIHSSKSPLGSPYLITGPFCGSTLSDIEPTLSRQALASVDRSLGRYVHELSRITGPYFGSMRQTTPAPQPWSRCFSGMMESVLRDAEDAMLSLPYDVINGQLRKHRSALDRISRPKLTLLEMASDKNILVHTKDMSVSGLLDFSSAIWGDPYLSDCFYQPSVSFAEGFGKLPNRTTDERVRQYLYVVYHSALDIVRHYYRPHERRDELTARRNLTSALTQLAAIK